MITLLTLQSVTESRYHLNPVRDTLEFILKSIHSHRYLNVIFHIRGVNEKDIRMIIYCVYSRR